MDTVFLNTLSQLTSKSTLPFQGQFELTGQCNFRCKMCYLEKPEGQKNCFLPASFWINLAEKAKAMGMLSLSITGGETLLYPELKVLMSELTQMGLLISFNTNGSLFDDQWVEWFDNHPVSKINISMYGSSNETYKKLCNCGTRQFDHVLHSIEQLKKHGHNVYITSVLTPENLHEQSQLYRIMSERSQELHIADYLYPSCNSGYKRVDPAVVSQFCYNRMCNTMPLAASIIHSRIESNKDPYSSIPVCNGGRSSFTVSYDGKLMPCVMMRHISYDLLVGSLTEGWKYISQAMAHSSIPDKCSHCKFAGITCPACKGSLHMEQERCGNTDYLCNIASELAQLAINNANPNIKIVFPGDVNPFSCGQ